MKLIIEIDIKKELVSLNLRVGIKVKVFIVYKVVIFYLKIGINLFIENSWLI